MPGEDVVMKVIRQGVAKNIELLKKSIQETNDPKERERLGEHLKKFEQLAEKVATEQE